MTHAETSQRCAAIARRVAEENPDVVLPCPECAAEVKGSNLDKHLRKVHSLEPRAAAPGTVRIVGSDHRMRFFAMAPVAIVIAGFYPAMLAAGEDFQPLLMFWLACFLLTSLVVIAAFLGKFSASVEVSKDGLTLRSGLGVLQRQVRLPIRVETGGLQQLEENGMAVGSDGYRGPSELAKVGSYLALHGSNNAKVILGAKRSTHPLKYWQMDHVQGKTRRLWDVDFKSVDLVRLQYLLVEVGVFSAKAAPTG